MRDDIVQELNELYLVFSDNHADSVARALSRAIDEIERLRADLQEMRQVVIIEHRRWCDRPCNAEEWNLHDW